MNTRTTMHTLLRAVLASSLAAAGCDKSGDTHSDAPPKESAASFAAQPTDLIKRIGVEPGPVVQDGGPAAVVFAASGTIEVRSIGEEEFKTASADQKLYPGDQLRAGEGAKATLVFPDESTVELAELTTLEVGSRVTTADPASSAAVLSGVARFGAVPAEQVSGVRAL